MEGIILIVGLRLGQKKFLLSQPLEPALIRAALVVVPTYPITQTLLDVIPRVKSFFLAPNELLRLFSCEYQNQLHAPPSKAIRFLNSHLGAKISAAFGSGV
jgi:hypothetical protein